MLSPQKQAFVSLLSCLHAGTLQVTRLLYLAACDTHEGIQLSQPSVMTALARLPGAQATSADCIATVIHNGIAHKHWQHLPPLLQLPGAKLISSQRLCQLILKAAQRKMMELFQKLCRCAAEAVCWHLACLRSSMPCGRTWAYLHADIPCIQPAGCAEAAGIQQARSIHQAGSGLFREVAASSKHY
jgi:hypothetical protein